MTATIKDVAEMANVSIATVSKYMNGGNLRDQYRVRVEKAVRELNYSVNEVARNLKMSTTQMIGIIAPDITSNFLANVIKNIQNALMEKGYISLILDCQLNPETEWKQLDVLTRWKVAGIILFPWFDEKALCEKILSMNIPLVLADQIIEGLDADCVVSKNYESAFYMTEKMIEAGHKKIALCRGPEGIYTADERSRGYEDAMKKHDLKPIIGNGELTQEGAYRVACQLLSLEERPTAFFSCSYYMTIGILRAFSEFGLSMPRDVSLAAFDRREYDYALPTRISCVNQPEEEIGRRVAELILQKAETGEEKQKITPQVHFLDTFIDLTDSIRKIG